MAAHPTALFNGASLDVLVPSSPSLTSSASPPPTTFTSLSEPTATAETDRWISKLLSCPPRPSLYTDEPLAAFAVLALPTSSSSPLSRNEAAALLLQSLPHPHLSLSLDLLHADPQQPVLSGSSHSFAHLQQQPPTRGSSLSALAARAPITPAPFPATLAEEDDEAGVGKEVAQGLGGVPIANGVFKEDGGRRWVGKDDGGRWVGVWEIEVLIRTLLSSSLQSKTDESASFSLHPLASDRAEALSRRHADAAR
jgi:hypothetical protein